jgi:CubicO group peptidase (beta-lactamase class C family)
MSREYRPIQPWRQGAGNGGFMRVVIASLLVASLIASPLSAQPRDAQTRADKLFESITKDTPGCAAGAMLGGKTVFAKGYGLADLEHQVPMTVQTPVYLASVSKQFTALTILLLERDGKLKRSDSVRKYIPELGAYADPITIEHLLTHTGGLRNYYALSDYAGNPERFVYTEADFLKVMGRQRSGDFPPGSKWAYSNSAYLMMSLIVERVSGKNLDATAREKIFAPLGMNSTRYQHDHRGLVSGKAVGYSRKDGAWRTTNVLFDTVGDGGMYSTIEDMLLWGRNFKAPKVGAEALALMQVSAVLTDGKKTDYGMGIASGDYRGLKTVFHNGGVAGYGTNFVYFPQADFAAVILCNRGGARTDQMAMGLADIWLDGQFKEPAKPAPKPAPVEVKLDPKLLDAYVGEYLQDETYAIIITREKDRLLADGTGRFLLGLTPWSERSFFSFVP